MRLLEGVVVAHLTFFDEEGKVDYPTFRRYIHFLAEKGVNGIFACGTTAEGQILSLEERKSVLETILDENQEKMTIVAHCGTTNLSETCALIEHARRISAHGAAVVTPFYYAYTQEELYEYYATIARKFTDFPLYLYNIPSLTKNDLSPSTVARLSREFPHLVGIKDSSGNFTTVSSYILETRADFRVIVGYDRAFLSALLLGAKGCVTGPGGVFPEPFIAVWEDFQLGDYQKALEDQRKLIAFSSALQEGANLAMLKGGIALRGFGNGRMRAPFRSLPPIERDALRKKLEKVIAETGYCDKITFIP